MQKSLFFKASLLGGLFLFSASARSGGDLYLYGFAQTQNAYDETGNRESGNVKYEHDFDSWPLGAGAEWRFADDGDFFFGAGASFQQKLKVQQTTTFYEEDQDPSSFTSRSGLPSMSFTDVYLNAYSRSNDVLKLFLGAQYTFPSVDASGRFEEYEIKNGFGYRLGLEFKLQQSLLAQIFLRQALLDTSDKNNYEGELNIGSLMVSVGWNFQDVL